MFAGLFIALGLGCSTKTPIAPAPMAPEELNVGVRRVAVVLAVSSGQDAEEPAFQDQIAALERSGFAPQMHWLGCHPELVSALQRGEQRWIATLSFPDQQTADAWLAATKTSPLAVATGTIEPCGD